MSNIIKVKDLSYRYEPGGPFVLHDICVEIAEGEFVAVMGPSGAGKTTFCLALNGIIPNFFGGNFHGQVSILDHDTLSLTVAELAQNVGMVLQDPEMQLVTNCVEDEVAFGLENVRVPRSEMRVRIDDALRIVRLTGYEKKHPASLSGGQKQRLAIAAALALRPKVMVLDEPTSQLDPVGANEVFSVIRELNERYHITVILVTHDSERVAEYADRVLLMNAGRLEADTTPSRFFQDLSLSANAAVRLPQIVDFYARYNQRVHPVPSLPTRFAEGLAQIERDWPSLNFLPRQYADVPATAHPVEASEPVISVRDLRFSYPDGTEALTGVSLEIRRGECVAIIGQNGGGKSTLVKHFVRLIKPTSGEVRVFGKSVLEYTTSTLAQRIGFVYQNPDSQIFSKTVEEEVSFGPANQLEDAGDVKRRVEAALESMDLVEYRTEHPLALSKGDRERVAVAAVLAMEPEVLIFDEPTTGQDMDGASRIMEIIRRLHAAGRTIIIITHHLHLLPGYVDRVVLMGDGTLIADAPLRRVFCDAEKLRETYLSPPQIVEFGRELERLGNAKLNAVTVDETLACFEPAQDGHLAGSPVAAGHAGGAGQEA